MEDVSVIDDRSGAIDLDVSRELRSGTESWLSFRSGFVSNDDLSIYSFSINVIDHLY